MGAFVGMAGAKHGRHLRCRSAIAEHCSWLRAASACIKINNGRAPDAFLTCWAAGLRRQRRLPPLGEMAQRANCHYAPTATCCGAARLRRAYLSTSNSGIFSRFQAPRAARTRGSPPCCGRQRRRSACGGRRYLWFQPDCVPAWSPVLGVSCERQLTPIHSIHIPTTVVQYRLLIWRVRIVDLLHFRVRRFVAVFYGPALCNDSAGVTTFDCSIVIRLILIDFGRG